MSAHLSVPNCYSRSNSTPPLTITTALSRFNMAVSPSKIAVVTGLGIISLAHVALAWQDTQLCLGSGCNDCPAFTTNSGNGFPTCRIYNNAGFYDDGRDLEEDFPEADDGFGTEVNGEL